MFSITNETDEQMFKSFSGLIKTAAGSFKSEKQAKFVLRMCETYSVESAKGFFGVDLIDGQVMYKVDCMNSWADYGSRGNIPQMFIFVLDTLGIVSKWKVPFNGNMRDGAAPAPERTTKMWERATDFVSVIPATPVAPAVAGPVSEHVGTVGEKITFSGVITDMRVFEGQRMGYWDSGVRYITTIQSGDNKFTYWGRPNVKGAEFGTDIVGMSVTVKATVKDHTEYKGVKSTVISRPSFKVA